MDPIYILTSGEYDDYGVACAVSGGPEKAQKLADRMNDLRYFGEKIRVEELPVVTSDVEPVVTILHLRTIIYDDGREAEFTERLQARWPWDDESLTGSEEVPAFWRWGHLQHVDHGALQAWGTDHARVRQVFETHRQELLRDELCGLRRMPHREGDR